jgi:hypothetical protein
MSGHEVETGCATRIDKAEGSSEAPDYRESAYARLCESYHAIDDFRMKLLGLLPVATGTGVFLLLNSNMDLLDSAKRQQHTLEQFLTAIGAFGFLFTLGLFAYELFGIKKCHYLIQTGRRLEISLDLQGQFRSRPPNLMGFINEPFASALIYPASMAAWIFLAHAFSSSPLRWWLPALVFALGVATTLGSAEGIKHSEQRAFRAEVFELITQQPDITATQIRQELHAEQEAVHRAITVLAAEGKVVKTDSDALRSCGVRKFGFTRRGCIRGRVRRGGRGARRRPFAGA